MGIILEPMNDFKGINIINSFLKENLQLQSQVFDLQKEKHVADEDPEMPSESIRKYEVSGNHPGQKSLNES